MKKKFIILFAALASIVSANAQIFYKVSGNGLEKPSYIFGTHHLAPHSVVDSIPSVKFALSEVDQVVGEIDMTKGQMAIAAALQPFMMAPADSTLRDLIAPGDFDRISKVFSQYAPAPGITLEAMSMMRPMVASSIVSIGIISKSMPGYNPNEQLDMFFQTEAKNNNKNVIGLETPEMQGKLLYTTTPLTKQASDLVELLDNPAKIVESGNRLNQAYLTQNLDEMTELSEKDDSDPKFMEALLDKRNADWLTKLPEIMRTGSSFIAVGALHLPGESGLVEGLRKKGYSVEAVRK